MRENDEQPEEKCPICGGARMVERESGEAMPTIPTAEQVIDGTATPCWECAGAGVES